MAITVDFQNASDSDDVPDLQALQRWSETALQSRNYIDAELCIRIVDSMESATLNHTYRHKEGATNILSFPSDLPEHIDLPLLGDLVICADVVNREAREQKKSTNSHWAHIVIHGTLHLIGYDHINDTDAEEMEALEIELLQQLGIDNPYH